MDKLRAAAEADRRSLNQEIVWLVELALQERESNQRWLAAEGKRSR
jgi:hypothetical protein